MQESPSQQNRSQNSGVTDFVPPKHAYITLDTYVSPYFTDHVQEEEQIQRAFTSNNYTYLRGIPNQIARGAILEERVARVQKGVGSDAAERSKTFQEKEEDRKDRAVKKKMEQIGTLGYFEVFPYEPSHYDRPKELRAKEQAQGKNKQRQISEVDFRPAGFDKKSKYEDPFKYSERMSGTPAVSQPYLFPFHLPQDTYDRFHQSELRDRIINEANKLYGDFVPSQQEKSLTKINRSKTPEILHELELYLRKFFPDTKFFLGMSKRDHIDVLFDKEEEENTKLQMLMSRLCESETMSRFMLRRELSRWGKVGQSGYLQFCLLPPWVRDPEEMLSSRNTH